MPASPDEPRQEPRNRTSNRLRKGKSANLAPPSLRALSKGVRSFQPTLPRKPSQPQPTDPKPAPITQNERPRPDDLRPRKSRLTVECARPRSPSRASVSSGATSHMGRPPVGQRPGWLPPARAWIRTSAGAGPICSDRAPIDSEDAALHQSISPGAPHRPELPRHPRLR
jgi:hypothetical protein